MKRKVPADLPDVPWISAEGMFLPAKFPIDSTLKQCVGPDSQEAESGCRMLAMMVDHGRIEAGIFLLGLLRYYEDDLGRLEAVVECLGSFKDTRCATALFTELRRIPSSNTTRRYLDTVIKALTRFPAELVQERFWGLSQDQTFSYRMRAKFKAAAETFDGGRGEARAALLDSFGE